MALESFRADPQMGMCGRLGTIGVNPVRVNVP